MPLNIDDFVTIKYFRPQERPGVEAARERVKQRIEAFLAATGAPVQALRVTTGVGKTRIAARCASVLLGRPLRIGLRHIVQSRRLLPRTESYWRGRAKAAPRTRAAPGSSLCMGRARCCGA